MCVRSLGSSRVCCSATRALKAALSSYGCLERGRQRNRGLFSGLVRGVSDPCEGSKILCFPFRPRLVCSSLLHLRSLWRNCLDIRNRSRIGVTKVVKRGRRSPDRPTLAAKEVRSRRLQLFSEQFLHEGWWMKWREDPNRPFRSRPGEDLRLSRSCSWSGRRDVWSPPCRSHPRHLCNPPRRCRARR